jgi:hypothetical protein
VEISRHRAYYGRAETLATNPSDRQQGCRPADRHRPPGGACRREPGSWPNLRAASNGMVGRHGRRDSRGGIAHGGLGSSLRRLGQLGGTSEPPDVRREAPCPESDNSTYLRHNMSWLKDRYTPTCCSHPSARTAGLGRDTQREHAARCSKNPPIRPGGLPQVCSPLASKRLASPGSRAASARHHSGGAR